MNKIAVNRSYAIRGLAISLLLALVVLNFATPTRADETYSYTGNSFTSFSGSDSCPSVCGISGSFTLASALPDSSAFPTTPTPISYSFTDGNFTWTSSNSSIAVFEFGTDSTGDINAWIISLYETSNIRDNLYSCGSSVCGSSFHYTGYDNSQLVEISPFSILGNAIVTNEPGTWIASSSSPSLPEPSSLLFLCTGLLGVAGMRRRNLFR